MGSGFKERLTERRRALGLTQESLAKSLGLAQGTVSAYETGYRSPDLDTLAKLAGRLGCTADWLLGSDDQPGWAGPFIKDLSEIDQDGRDILLALAKVLARKEGEVKECPSDTKG
jgi:transcriptional regulator with XRE-family HTH domain